MVEKLPFSLGLAGGCAGAVVVLLLVRVDVLLAVFVLAGALGVTAVTGIVTFTQSLAFSSVKRSSSCANAVKPNKQTTQINIDFFIILQFYTDTGHKVGTI